MGEWPPRSMRRDCPTCVDQPLTERFGERGEPVCAQCGGRLLDAAMTGELLGDTETSKQYLLELVQFFGGIAGACPSCRSRLRVARMRGVWVSPCLGCGSLWLPAGALSALTSATVRELRPVFVPGPRRWQPSSLQARVRALGVANLVALGSLFVLALVGLGSPVRWLWRAVIMLNALVLPASLLFALTALIFKRAGALEELRRAYRYALAPWWCAAAIGVAYGVLLLLTLALAPA